MINNFTNSFHVVANEVTTKSLEVYRQMRRYLETQPALYKKYPGVCAKISCLT